jgi:hypothetical protein
MCSYLRALGIHKYKSDLSVGELVYTCPKITIDLLFNFVRGCLDHRARIYSPYPVVLGLTWTNHELIKVNSL